MRAVAQDPGRRLLDEVLNDLQVLRLGIRHLVPQCGCTVPEVVDTEYRADNRIGGGDPRRVHPEPLLELMDQPGAHVVDKAVGYLGGNDLAAQAMPAHTLGAASANDIRKVVGEDVSEDPTVGHIGVQQLVAHDIFGMR